MSEQQTTEQRLAATLQLSPKGAEMLGIMVQETLPDETQQQRWREFDAAFRQRCITEAAGNVALDQEAFAAFAETAPETGVESGLAVYNACNRALAGLEGHDCRVFKCMAQLYLSAKMALKFR